MIAFQVAGFIALVSGVIMVARAPALARIQTTQAPRRPLARDARPGSAHRRLP
jgi:hypothetical protein